MGAALSSHGHGAYGLRQNADINVTPFVDVMLVLLIIFMVALPVSTVSVKVDLPEASGARLAAPPPVVVSVQAGGRLFVGDRPTTLDALAGEVRNALGGASGNAARIHLRGDEGVPYGAMMAVMNRLRAAGYAHIGLMGEEA